MQINIPNGIKDSAINIEASPSIPMNISNADTGSLTGFFDNLKKLVSNPFNFQDFVQNLTGDKDEPLTKDITNRMDDLTKSVVNAHSPQAFLAALLPESDVKDGSNTTPNALASEVFNQAANAILDHLNIPLNPEDKLDASIMLLNALGVSDTAQNRSESKDSPSRRSGSTSEEKNLEQPTSLSQVMLNHDFNGGNPLSRDVAKQLAFALDSASVERQKADFDTIMDKMKTESSQNKGNSAKDVAGGFRP